MAHKAELFLGPSWTGWCEFHLSWKGKKLHGQWSAETGYKLSDSALDHLSDEEFDQLSEALKTYFETPVLACFTPSGDRLHVPMRYV